MENKRVVLTAREIEAAAEAARPKSRPWVVGACVAVLFLLALVWVCILALRARSSPDEAPSDTDQAAASEQEVALVKSVRRPWPSPPPMLDFGPNAVGFVEGERIVQIIDGHNCLASVKSGRDDDYTVVWLENFPTSASADGDKIGFYMAVKCVGRRSYTAASGGQRTVHALLYIPGIEAWETHP